MKRYGNLFDKIISMENLEEAYRKARKRKTWQRKVKKIDKNKEHYLKLIRESLINGTYRTSEYKIKKVYEPKERTIYVLPFYPDRIVQHAIMNIVSPIWEKFFIKDSYACRVGMGQHRGSQRCMQFVKRNKYYLQCDVSKFYPSINHEKLIEIVRRKIKDKKVLALLEEIINSIDGVPIGNYTSQWFGNLYLNELDNKIKNKYRVDYIRYCDDFLFFSNDKNILKTIINDIKDIMSDLRLRLSKCNLSYTKFGVDFLGYRHFSNGKILLRKSTAKRVRKRIKKLLPKFVCGKISKISARSTIASTYGLLKWANTNNFKKSIKLQEVKNIILGG